MGQRSALQRQAGFTLSELCVVLGLMSMMLSVTAGAAGWMLPRWFVRTAASSIATSLRAGRTAAILERTEVAVAFDVAGREYTRVARASSTARRAGLPDNVQFVRPDYGASVTLKPPGTSATAALFSSKGLLQSENLPGCVYIGDPDRETYAAVCVSVVGIVDIRWWDGWQWE